MGLARWPTGNKKVFFWVTDGQGRHLVFADSTGGLNSGDYDLLYGRNGGKYAGGTSSASSFQADRFSTPELPGVSFFRNRAYDRNTGRWTQEDPIGIAGGLNLYQFNGNNPVAFTDPFGLCPMCFLALAYAAYEIGSGIYDAYTAAKTLFDPDASAGQKASTVGLAVAGFVLPGGGYTALDDLANAAKAMDRGGFTAAGRSLTKHAAGQRAGSGAFPRLSGNPARINAAAQEIVEDVLTHPGTEVIRLTTGRFKGGVVYYEPSGRGVRFDEVGKFAGFVER
jgi:RHS repeat-associated protein